MKSLKRRQQTLAAIKATFPGEQEQELISTFHLRYHRLTDISADAFAWAVLTAVKDGQIPEILFRHRDDPSLRWRQQNHPTQKRFLSIFQHHRGYR